LQAWEQKESRESDAVEDAQHSDEGEQGVGEEGRVSLQVKSA
jgi:hypothetical protein